MHNTLIMDFKTPHVCNAALVTDAHEGDRRGEGLAVILPSIIEVPALKKTTLVAAVVAVRAASSLARCLFFLSTDRFKISLSTTHFQKVSFAVWIAKTAKNLIEFKKNFLMWTAP